jgi:hypothetical protein
MDPFTLIRIWILEAQKHGTLHVVEQNVPVVWLLLESEGAAVVEVGGKLAWRALAQDIDGRGHFLLRDPLILLLLGGGPQSLPGEGALKQIFHDFFWVYLPRSRTWKRSISLIWINKRSCLQDFWPDPDPIRYGYRNKQFRSGFDFGYETGSEKNL